MPGIIPLNTSVEVDGSIKVTNVPNATGTLLTYNASNKIISTRTNSQILTDLGLVATISSAHTHNNMSVLNGITSAKVANWDFAYGYSLIGHLRLSGGVINGNTYNMLGLTGTNATGGASIVFANASASPGILGKLGFRNDGQFVMSKGTTTDGNPDLLSIDANGLLELYSNLKFNSVDSSLIDRYGNTRFTMRDDGTIISANDTDIYFKAGGENSSTSHQVIINNKGVIIGRPLGGSWLNGHTISMGIKFNAPSVGDTYSGWIAQRTHGGGSWGIGGLGESFFVTYINPSDYTAGNNVPRQALQLDSDMGVTLTGLSGSGTRMVVVNGNGRLSTQAVPGGSSGSFMPLNTGRPNNNMETLRTSGIYGGGEGAGETTNKPAGAYGYSPYMVMQSGTDRFVQLWFDSWNGNTGLETIRYRVGTNTTYGAWRSLIHSGNIGNGLTFTNNVLSVTGAISGATNYITSDSNQLNLSGNKKTTGTWTIGGELNVGNGYGSSYSLINIGNHLGTAGYGRRFLIHNGAFVTDRSIALSNYTDTGTELQSFYMSSTHAVFRVNNTNYNLATESWVTSNYIAKTHVANNITTTNINNWNTAYGWGDYRTYSSSSSTRRYLGANYIQGGLEKPNFLGSGKLELRLLNGSNLGSSLSGWFDVLWMSSYTGSDVKSSTAIVSSKYTGSIGFMKQNYDATSWGQYYDFIHSGNLGTGLAFVNGLLTVTGGGGSGGDADFKTISLDSNNLDGLNRNGFIHKNSYENVLSEESDQTGLLSYAVRLNNGQWASPFSNPSEFYGKIGVRFYDVSDYTTQGTIAYSSSFSAELDYYWQYEKYYLLVYYDPVNDISQSGWFDFEELMSMKKACYGENHMMCLLGKMILEDNIHSIDVDPKYF